MKYNVMINNIMCPININACPKYSNLFYWNIFSYNTIQCLMCDINEVIEKWY